MRWGFTAAALACAAAAAAAAAPASRAAADAGAPDPNHQAHGASFDCAKASTRTEKMICADGELADLDGQVARFYRLALSSDGDPAALKAEQRSWLAGERNKCTDVACLREVHEKRLARLALLAARARPPGSPIAPPKPAAAGTPAVRKVPFPGGETTVAREPSPIAGLGDLERITVRDANGRVESQSTCNPGDFDDFSALFTRLKDAVVREDRAAVVKLMASPLRVNDATGKKAKTFRSPAELLKAYDQIFTAEVLGAIRRLEPAALFCRNGSVTSGRGMLWADSAGGDAPRISVINR